MTSRLLKLVGGVEKELHGRSYLEIRTPLSALEHGNIPEHIKRYRLTVPRELHHKRIYFIDIENCGLSSNYPIHTISLGTLNGSFVVKTFFAPDYFGEKPILQRTLNCLRGAYKVFTYNGDAFDLDRLSKRMQIYRLFRKEDKTTDLKVMLAGKHVDLYPIMAQQANKQDITLPDHTLQTLEKVLFHTHREDEVRGRDIPAVYEAFVLDSNDFAERESQVEAMARVIQHNQLDVASMGALLPFLKQQGIDFLR